MKKSYITEAEKEKCRQVADAFAELYELENILVMDAGRYGFVKLQYYTENQGLIMYILLRTAGVCLKISGWNGWIRNFI